jgi:hypothetical protein
MTGKIDRAARAAIAPTLAIILGALSLLPIVDWIPRGEIAIWYDIVSDVWIGGTLLVVGVGVLIAIASRRIPALWRDGLLDGWVDRWRRAPRAGAVLVSVGALILYCAIALLVFDGRALLIDEVAQLLHAEAYTNGMLWRPVPPNPEFFSSFQFIEESGRSFSHFPPGGPATLAVGLLLGASWLAVPLCGAIAVYAFASIVGRIESRPGVAFAATLLFAFAPFMAFMSGTHMNHVPVLMWVLIGAAALLRVTASTTPLPWTALVSGLGFGAGATIRPADAVAFALPAAVWYLALAVRDRRRWRDALAAAIGVAIPLAALMWVNASTTGSPLEFGYEKLWGPGVGLGFHQAPWGPPHTPLRGLELLNLYFLQLGVRLYESPIPGVLPALIAFGLSRRLSAGDRYLLASSALLAGVYFAYWFNGLYLGPRFMIPMVPVFAIWTARFLPAVRDRLGNGLSYRAVVYASVMAALGAVAVMIPSRTREYAQMGQRARTDVDGAAKRAGVANALVFVREPWGTQLLARLWVLDIPRPEARRIRVYVDQCLLDQKLAELERDNVRGVAALAALRPLMRDSARVMPVMAYGTRNGGRLPRLEYSSACQKRIEEDRAGTADLHPLLLAQPSGNVYARDLHAQDTVLLAALPDRPVYLLRTSSTSLGASPVFFPLSRDSLWVAWTGHSRAAAP